MRAIAAVLLLAVVGSGSTGAFASSGQARAALRFVTLRPLVARGDGFRPGEKVTFLVTAPGPARFALRATAGGSVLLRTTLRPRRCDAVVIQAFGSRGSRATIDRTLPVGCGGPDGPPPQ
jgi:hypothetical protein